MRYLLVMALALSAGCSSCDEKTKGPSSDESGYGAGSAAANNQPSGEPGAPAPAAAAAPAPAAAAPAPAAAAPAEQPAQPATAVAPAAEAKQPLPSEVVKVSAAKQRAMDRAAKFYIQERKQKEQEKQQNK